MTDMKIGILQEDGETVHSIEHYNCYGNHTEPVALYWVIEHVINKSYWSERKPNEEPWKKLDKLLLLLSNPRYQKKGIHKETKWTCGQFDMFVKLEKGALHLADISWPTVKPIDNLYWLITNEVSKEGDKVLTYKLNDYRLSESERYPSNEEIDAF